MSNGELPRQATPWKSYLLSLVLMATATTIGIALRPAFSVANLLIIYLFAVIVAAMVLGRGPAILASVLGVLAFDFFLVHPRFTLAVDDTEYLLTFLGLLAVGVVISTLADRFRAQANTAERRANETAMLNNLSRDLAAAGTLDAIVHIVIDSTAKVFGRQVVVLLPGPGGEDGLVLSAPGPEFTINDREQAVAAWAFSHGQAAGRGTDTLSEAEARYLPLKTARGIVGILGVKPLDPASRLTPDQRRLLEAFASLAALAIERAHLSEEAEHARLQVESERMRSSLLSSVSHDLRTPLTAITGAASSLMVEDQQLDAGTRLELAQGIYEEANRLNVLVRNLLDMTRLESGAIHVSKAWQLVEEVIGAALTRTEPILAGRPVTVCLAPDLPLVPLDEVSIEQVLINLIENAVKYTPAGTPIELAAWPTGTTVVVEVADRGPGLSPGDEERVFEKFYRARPQAGGVGLGLAICRSIVEAHGGRIWAGNRPQGGATFRFDLPVEGQPPALPLDGASEDPAESSTWSAASIEFEQPESRP